MSAINKRYTLTDFLEVLDRTQNGPVCTQDEWNKKIIPRTVKEKVEEYHLRGTFDPENLINRDDSLADEFWKAGFAMAVETGMLCVNTERRIVFTEEELENALKSAPSELILGTGKDRVRMLHRMPEDRYPIITLFGNFGTPYDEELGPAVTAIALQSRAVDGCNCPGSPLTIHGRDIKAGTPYEVLGGMYEVQLGKAGARMAGRPGVTMQGASGVDATSLAYLGTYGTPKGSDPEGDVIPILPMTCLKTSYYLLNKTALIYNASGIAQVSHYSMIGGYCGGPEGSAVSAIASLILCCAVHHADMPFGTVFDARGYGGSSRETLWANSIAVQAESRNTKTLPGTSTGNCIAGPCTDMILYELAVQGIGHAVSGASYTLGLRPRMGRYPNYTGVLENRFAGETCKASCGISRNDANEIVKSLVKKYEDRMEKPPQGKSFRELVDLRTLKPHKECFDVYNKVKKELIDLGVPL